MKKYIFLITLLVLTRSALSMTSPETVPITIMDKSGNIVTEKRGDEVIPLKINHNTFLDVQKISGALQDPNYPMIFRKNLQGEYSISLPLTEQQIQLLFAISTHKNNIGKAIALRKVPFKNITRADIAVLQLPSELQRYFDNLIILETKDNLLIPVKKNIVTHFFKTIDNFAQDFENALIIPIPVVRKFGMGLLYYVVKGFPISTSSITFDEWEQKVATTKKKIEQFLNMIKQKENINTMLLNTIQAAYWLEAELFILAALYEIYASKAPEDIWPDDDKRWQKTDDKLKQVPQLLQRIHKLIERQYPSIEDLLKTEKKVEDFYTIVEWKPHNRRKELAAIFSGKQIYKLQGLSEAPGIKECKSIFIENTNVFTLKEEDFKNLSNIIFLQFENNQNLKEFKEGWAEKLDNLKYLVIMENKMPVTFKPSGSPA